MMTFQKRMLLSVMKTCTPGSGSLTKSEYSFRRRLLLALCVIVELLVLPIVELLFGVVELVFVVVMLSFSELIICCKSAVVIVFWVIA